MRSSRQDESTSLLEDEGPLNDGRITSSMHSNHSDRSYHSYDSILKHFHSTNERDAALSKEGVGAAAFLIRDAVLDEVENPSEGTYDPYLFPEAKLRNTVSVVCRRLCALRPLVHVLQAAACIPVLLTFVEPPHWCREYPLASTRNSDSTTTDDGCPRVMTMMGVPASSSDSVEAQLYPNSSSMLLTVAQSRDIEWTCLALIFFFVVLRIGRDGMSLQRYLRRGSSCRNRVTQILCLAAMSYGLWTSRTEYQAYFRLALLVSFSASAQRDIHVLIRLLPEVVNILTLLFVFMTFYAWFGTVMFAGTPEGRLIFSSFVESLWTLWICVTTANYPDVMMPAYNANRWVALYFVSFMVMSFFFLMNVILAAVVNEYDTVVAHRRTQREESTSNKLRRAYKLLDPHDTGRIDRETVMALFCILNDDFQEFRFLQEEDTKLLFAVLDKDGSSTITEDEFMDFGNVLMLEFVKSSEYASFVELHLPKLFHSEGYQRFCRVVKSDTFEYAIDLILFLNAVVIAVQTYPELSGEDVHLDQKYYDGTIDTVWELMETVFTAIYCLEVVMKVTVFGWKTYIEKQRNAFDFTITVMAVVSSAIVYYPNEISDSRLIRMIVMARVIRLIRLLTAMKNFQLIGRISAEILPQAASVILVLFFVMYFFAALGMQLYGGLVTRDPSNPLAYLILDTDFSDNDYWSNNFNDMISGMNVLFNLLVINNWTECEVGYEAVTQGKWVRYFFLMFHFIGVILVNNLVIAFIINSFLQQLAIFRERTDAEVVGNGEAVIHDRRAVFDAETVTGTRTSLSGAYIARLRHSNSDIAEGGEQARLRLLFTHKCAENKIERGDLAS